MKRLLALTLAVVLLLCSVAAADLDLDSMTITELIALRDRINVEISARSASNGRVVLDNATDRVELLTYHTNTVYFRGPLVMLVFSWTNRADQARAYQDVEPVDLAIFQNDAQLVFFEYDNAGRSVARPGASVEVTAEFFLNDTTSPVEVVASVGGEIVYCATIPISR